MNNIETNLYEFYRFFGSVKNTRYESVNNFEMVYSENKSWPQMIFNLNQQADPQKLILQISEEIVNYNYPRHFIVPESYISKRHTELLKANAIIPVKIMTGMKIDQENMENIIPEKCNISALKNDDDLEAFTNMIRSEFISPELNFNTDILREISTKDEIQMYGLFHGKNLASSLMVFINEGIAGLYFIVTGKEYQNKGYATTLIKFVLNQLFNKGIKEVVLHANHYSFALYKKIGFTEQNRFVVYKKL